MVEQMVEPHCITGLVVAGGLGRRMGGVDKGLQALHGVPLAQHALLRLAPQVGLVAVNANRHFDLYGAFGVPVWPDTLPDHPGPLAGWLTGLQRCTTPYLATVPCDTPGFPLDLVQRLAAGLVASGADMAIATTPGPGAHTLQPAFSLMKTALAGSLQAGLLGGERALHRWCAAQHCVQVAFDDGAAFDNINTADDLRRLG